MSIRERIIQAGARAHGVHANWWEHGHVAAAREALLIACEEGALFMHDPEADDRVLVSWVRMSRILPGRTAVMAAPWIASLTRRRGATTQVLRWLLNCYAL